MKKGLTIVAAVMSVCLIGPLHMASGNTKQKTGESLFNQFCAECHADGGNLMNPQKTLSRKDREANGIKTAEDIVNRMRNRGPFASHPSSRTTMKTFDEATIPVDDAYRIARYILETFQ